MRTERTTYIDNIRVYLTILVIFHHAAVTYGGPGSWYYSEENSSRITGILLTLFVSCNQAFFMGFFFFLSSLFIPSSYLRKGSSLFLIDRVKRLGIPLVLYSLVLAPVTIYLMLRFSRGATYSFVDYYIHREQWIDFGVLWFAAALLIFTIIYWLYRQLPLPKSATVFPFPSNRYLFLFALLLGVISFFVRIVFPVGWVLQPLGFQLGHFTQYMALFVVGIIAYQSNWLQYITYQKGIQWLRIALILIAVGFPSMFAIKEVTNSPLTDFLGGFSFTSFISCVWEQLLGISLIMTFLGIGKHKWNTEKPLLKPMARSAFAVYIIHPLVLVSVSLLMMNVLWPPAVKFICTGTVSVIASFLLGNVLVKIPGVKDVI